MSSASSGLVGALTRKALQYFYAFLVLLHLSWRLIRTGGAALKLKKRQMPRKLLDDYTHKYILLPSGINMHYVEAGDPTAPLMVMVHGYPEFWYSWRFQIAHFKDRYRVVAIDQRGYGESTKPPNIADYDINLLAKDIDDLINGLGHESAVVLSHDWGGVVTWTHAMQYPTSVDRLVVCNCPHPAAFGHLIRTSAEQRSKSWYMLFYQNAAIPEAALQSDDFAMFHGAFWSKAAGLRNKTNFTAEDMEAWKCTFSKPDCLTSAINYYRSNLYLGTIGRKSYEKCKVKTLIVWGDEDMFLLKEGANISTQWCDDATLQFIPGASHWVQQDAPQLVNEHIDNFLQ